MWIQDWSIPFVSEGVLTLGWMRDIHVNMIPSNTFLDIYIYIYAPGPYSLSISLYRSFHFMRIYASVCLIICLSMFFLPASYLYVCCIYIHEYVSMYVCMHACMHASVDV